MSRAAKQILKDKHRKKKFGPPQKKTKVSRRGLWILLVAGLIVLGLVVAQIAVQGGFGN